MRVRVRVHAFVSTAGLTDVEVQLAIQRSGSTEEVLPLSPVGPLHPVHAHAQLVPVPHSKRTTRLLTLSDLSRVAEINISVCRQLTCKTHAHADLAWSAAVIIIHLDLVTRISPANGKTFAATAADDSAAQCQEDARCKHCVSRRVSTLPGPPPRNLYLYYLRGLRVAVHWLSNAE